MRGQSVTEFGLNLADDELFISKEDHARMIRAEVIPGDILLTIAGSTGIACVVSGLDRANINQAIVKARPGEAVRADYLAYFLNSDLGKKQTDRLANGAVQLNINFSEAGEVKVVLPPLPIQDSLVKGLEAARATRQQKLIEADALLAGVDSFVLQQLGLVVPQEEKQLAFAVRLGAAKSRSDAHFHQPDFHHLARVVQSGNHVALRNVVSLSKETWLPENESAESFRYIEISGVNLQTGEASAAETLVSEAPSRARMRVRNGDLIVSLTRPHHGAIAMIGDELDQCVASTGFAVIRHITDVRVQPLYLWCILRSALCLQQMLQRSSGGNYPAITEAELGNIVLPLPSAEIQQIIVAEVTRRREQARRLREEANAGWQAAKARFEQQLLGE